MKIRIENDLIYINDFTPQFLLNFKKQLSYVDKAKQYQLKKMEKNPFLRKSPAYTKLKQEINGNLVQEISDSEFRISSGFAYLFKHFDIDNRKDTGKAVTFPWKKKPFDPRDYQEEAVELMLNSWRGVINLATGAGKTLTTIHYIRRFGKKTLIICPGKGIADNFYSELVNAFGENKIGYYGGGKKKIKDITVGIAQSVINGIEDFKKENLGAIVVDEAHHTPATIFSTIATELGSVGRIFGLTATNFRNDGKDVMIEAAVGPTLISRDLIWCIDNGWLADPYFIVREVPTTGQSFRDDKLKNYKEHVLNSELMTQQIIQDCQKFIDAGKHVLCLVDEKAHGEVISKALGLPFANGDDKKSSDYIVQLNDGKLPGLVGTDSRIGEGVDTKRVDVLVLANFVASKGILWQNIGRGMRLYGDKKAVVVLDYAPLGSAMLKRHSDQRIAMYKEITDNVKVVKYVTK